MKKPDVLKIGIQGVAASFHDVAARQFFSGSEVEAVECSTFKILCERLALGETKYAVMAIENAIAGSILTNYSLLENYKFKIMGELYLPISFDVMALPGQTLKDIKFIQSHPMALYQCEEFLFENRDIKILESNDTAESAKNIAERSLKGYAALASRLAAQKYGLEILAEKVETNSLNYTRFLAICHSDDYEPRPEANKASLRFETAHTPGSLASALHVIKDRNINLTKIQSIPILGKPHQYSIHLDVEFDDVPTYRQALTDLRKITSNLLEFGEYERGRGIL